METTGCGTAIVTPFRADGSVDEPALWALVNWQIESGIDFLVACGSTGEAATLDEDEWLNTVRAVVEAAAGRVPVWAAARIIAPRHWLGKPPCSPACMAQRRSIGEPVLQQADAGGPVPAFHGAGQSCRSAPGVPLQRAGPHRGESGAGDGSAFGRAARNIQAIKEASGRLTQFAELAHILPRWFKIFSGDDNLTLGAIGVGAHGLISVASNEIPKEVAQMVRAALNNNWAEARELERRFSPLFEANFWSRIRGRSKTVLKLMGKCGDHLRLPLVPPTAATQSRLERLAGELGLLKHVPMPAGYRSEVF